MNNPPDISQTLDDADGPLDPQQAAALLEQATQRARRTLTPVTPQLWLFRAAFVLVAFGGFWLSVRGQQNPYSGPNGWSLLVAFALVATNIAWTTAALRLTVITGAIGLVATIAGLGGPVGVWLIMGIGLCAICLAAAAFTAWQRHHRVILP